MLTVMKRGMRTRRSSDSKGTGKSFPLIASSSASIVLLKSLNNFEKYTTGGALFI